MVSRFCLRLTVCLLVPLPCLCCALLSGRSCCDPCPVVTCCGSRWAAWCLGSHLEKAHLRPWGIAVELCLPCHCMVVMLLCHFLDPLARSLSAAPGFSAVCNMLLVPSLLTVWVGSWSCMAVLLHSSSLWSVVRASVCFLCAACYPPIGHTAPLLRPLWMGSLGIHVPSLCIFCIVHWGWV